MVFSYCSTYWTAYVSTYSLESVNTIATKAVVSARDEDEGAFFIPAYDARVFKIVCFFILDDFGFDNIEKAGDDFFSNDVVFFFVVGEVGDGVNDFIDGGLFHLLVSLFFVVKINH